MKRKLSLLLFVPLSLPVWSDDQSMPPLQDELVVAMNMDEEMALFNIMNILNVETEIATKSKVNADYVPGIVTVLKGEQLEMMGVEDVHGALQYVPGANLVSNNYGRKGVTVRGIGGAFGSS
ncbi:MAG: Plug domain-containing protein, partial [Gammaproteobacteria bacterium]|nr:Plug domain-containing protein [Gammaproteobacteria bacterium]